MLSFPCFFRVTSLFSFFPPDARIHSIVIHKYIPFKRLFAPKTAVSLTVFTWSGRRKKKNGKKLKFPMNWRRLNVFSPLSVLMPNLISRVKKKNKYVFSESKLVPPVPQISGSEMGRLMLMIILFRVQFRIKQHE